eukprot:gene12262-biopygen2407
MRGRVGMGRLKRRVRCDHRWVPIHSWACALTAIGAHK